MEGKGVRAAIIIMMLMLAMLASHTSAIDIAECLILCPNVCPRNICCSQESPQTAYWCMWRLCFMVPCNWPRRE
ncbi:hypothetical protein FRX31_017321 [Thalictrum thalictroides]|uniref:Uncharacterized protein n=1 Tax=Thalictrum thalictroides TaxID=46969 RepID=A0A7J6WA55_THATH|nr:hypothetical protein FRX31_017321 [Thalictrum thalictroides]